MKHFLPLAFLGAALTFSSCIQDEPLNAECDITGIDSLWLGNHKAMIIGDPIVTNTTVSVTVKKGTDRTQLDPMFYLTPGAQIFITGEGTPGNGVMRDFTSPQLYTVRSEDGNWSKDYTVSFNYPHPISVCSFEHFVLDDGGKFYQWHEMDPSDEQNPRRNYWATGNAGFAMSGMAKTAEDYPTAPNPLGVRGNCVRLRTSDTGAFGASTRMPIAAGNIFIGEFKTSQAMLFPRKATRMGLQLVGGEPVMLTGYYKYTPGEVFYDKNKEVVEGRRDKCDVYAVLYEVDPAKFAPLNGDDVLTSDRIVSVARLENPEEPKEWTRFELPFVMREGKTFDRERMNNDGYAITIVASSSRDGQVFEGAIGSELFIDELEIVWK